AVSFPRALVTPHASSSRIAYSGIGVVGRQRRAAEAADPLPLENHESDQPGWPEQDDEQQQQPQDDGPDLLEVVGEPEVDNLDRDDADDGADQRTDATK